jgi:hypothetical protein
MSQFNYVGSGNPGSTTEAPAAAAANYYDTFNNALWLSSGSGWKPSAPSVVSKAVHLAATGAVANLLTYAVPVSGTYRITVTASQATSTNGTLPTATATYTDFDTATASVSINVIGTGVATTGIGQAESGSVLVTALAGTNIVVATGAPTTLTANIRTRIEYVS